MPDESEHGGHGGANVDTDTRTISLGRRAARPSSRLRSWASRRCGAKSDVDRELRHTDIASPCTYGHAKKVSDREGPGHGPGPFFVLKPEWACKPDSVEDDHLSGAVVTGDLDAS